jgi:hypothetical protein
MELHDSSGSGKSVFQNVGGNTYIGQLAKGSGDGDLYMLTGGNGTSANVSMVIKCAGNVGIGTSSPIGNAKVDIRTSCPLTSEVGQPLFLGSNDVTGPLGVVIQHLCGHGVCRVDFTSTRYGISGNDLSLNVDSSDPNTAGGLYIKYRGNVGIGTSSPNRKLTISRATESSSPQIELRNVGGISDGNFDGISFTQGSTGDVPLGSIRLKNSSIGYPGFGIYTRNSSTTESEKFTLTNVGNIGVGTDSPASRFHITHTSSQGACTIILQTTDTCANGTISWRSCAGVTQAQIGSNYNVGDSSGNLEFITSGNTRLLVTSGGNIGMGITSPSYRLHVNGTFYAAGSSIEYKEGISQYDTDSCLFMCLKPKTYQYKDEWKHLGKELKSGTQIGLIAEEVAEIMPELAVLVNEEENKVVRNVDYEKLSIILLSEVQKLRKEVDNLKNNK